jgi:NitT/TauT family transport system permease protein
MKTIPCSLDGKSRMVSGTSASFVILWHLLTANDVVAWLRFNRMPTLGAVWESFMSVLGTSVYYENLLASVQRILLGFLLAAVVGVILGIAIGRSEVVRKTLRPSIEIVRLIPATVQRLAPMVRAASSRPSASN